VLLVDDLLKRRKVNEVVLLEVVVTGGMARPITTHHQNHNSSDLFYSSEPFTRLLCISLIFSRTQSEPDTFYFRFPIPFTFVGSSSPSLPVHLYIRVPRHLPLIVSRELNSASRRLHTRIVLINSPFSTNPSHISTWPLPLSLAWSVISRPFVSVVLTLQLRKRLITDLSIGFVADLL